MGVYAKEPIIRERRPRGIKRWVALLIAAMIATVAGLYVAAGFLDRSPTEWFAAQGKPAPVAALYLSGDMGLRFGMGPTISHALAAHGITVMGFSSPAVFGRHRDRAFVDTAIANAIRDTLAHSGGEKVVLIGQSYGADILQTGLAHLPVDLRDNVAAIILVVPGDTVFFRADPSNFTYHGTPDSKGVTTGRAITWAPLTCIYGLSENDSLCPHLTQPNARRVGMSGGHFLQHDADRLIANVLDAIHAAVPGFNNRTD